MSFRDVLLAEINFFIANPICILTYFVPTFLGMILFTKVIDFIFIWIALKKSRSDDDKADKNDD